MFHLGSGFVSLSLSCRKYSSGCWLTARKASRSNGRLLMPAIMCTLFRGCWLTARNHRLLIPAIRLAMFSGYWLTAKDQRQNMQNFRQPCIRWIRERPALPTIFCAIHRMPSGLSLILAPGALPQSSAVLRISCVYDRNKSCLFDHCLSVFASGVFL